MMNFTNVYYDHPQHYHNTSTSGFLTNVTSVPVSPSSWYLSNQILLYGLQVGVAGIGIFTNFVNIFVFLKSGLSDSITVSFFSLSIADLLHLICFSTIRMLSILQNELGVSSDVVRLQDLGGFFGWVALYFMDVSMYITVFTTFQKCCCVALPLTFKNSFTKQRSDIVIGLIFTATFVIFLPVFVNIFDKWLFDKSTRDLPLDWVALNTSTEATVWRWMHRIVLTFSSQIIVIVSLAVITAKLKKSAKFRSLNKAGDKDTDTTQKETKSFELGHKEVRAIQSVQLIAFIFIVTTLPANVNSLVTTLFPALSQPRYRHIVFTVVSVIYFGATINASVNIIVYLNFNRKYRSVLLKMIHGLYCCFKESQISEE